MGGVQAESEPTPESWVDLASVRAGLDLHPDPVFVHDEAMRVVAVNERARAFFGDVVADLDGTPVLHLVHPEDGRSALASFREVADRSVATPIEIRLRAGDGTWRSCEVTSASYGHPDGRWQVSALRDLTTRRRLDVATGDPDRFRTIVEFASVVLALVDADGTIQSVSGGMRRLLGHDPAAVVGTNLAEWVADADRELFLAAYADAVRRSGSSLFECRLRDHEGGEVLYQLALANALDDPIAAGMIVSGHDISGRRELENRLEHLATHDSLTGLANRGRLVDYLEQACSARVDPDLDGPSAVGVVFVDLDRLKTVNDLYGHGVGDELLVAVAQRLRTHVRPDDLVARLGGDEFVVVCPDIDPDQALPTIVDRIERAISHPVAIAGLTLAVDASVGYVTAQPGSSADAVLAEADDVMYRVKQARRGGSSASRLGVAARRGLVEDLRAALDGDPTTAGLHLHYQPIVELTARTVVGAEALVRWQHPEHGLLRPDQFLPVAEDAGLDVGLGGWVMRAALDQLVAWDLPFTMSVNLSTSQIIDPALDEIVWSTLTALDLPPGRLCLEVTQTQVFGATRRRRAPSSALRTLGARGIVLALDDFGTGLANLARLREYPADILKIDRTFVTDVTSDQIAVGACAAVVALARAAGKTTVAVGVETAAQAEVLSAMGVDRAQGHHFGRAVPAGEFRA
jgi:diguanylate cyclase (GGDEF)-like protein/PAS domain S-box-containing protein